MDVTATSHEPTRPSRKAFSIFGTGFRSRGAGAAGSSPARAGGPRIELASRATATAIANRRLTTAHLLRVCVECAPPAAGRSPLYAGGREVYIAGVAPGAP